jgi:Uncharacterized proteins, LmbE homologs
MLDFTNKSVLVVAPHLDDVELGMGGNITQNKSKQSKIHTLYRTFFSSKC